MKFCTQDVAAALSAVLTIGGIIYLSAAGLPVPNELAAFAGLASGWLFARGTTIARNGGSSP